jgi:lipopolysaccharide export LptBFGC system permease protein LptF
VLLRVSDVLVGVVAGAVCSVLAAGFEAFIVTFRFISVGHVGGGLGSKVALIAFLGAIVGGIVGLAVGAIVKPRERGPAS